MRLYKLELISNLYLSEHEKLKSISDSRGGGLDLSKPSGLIGNLDLELTADVKDWDTQCQYSKLEKEFRNKASSYGSNVSFVYGLIWNQYSEY